MVAPFCIEHPFAGDVAMLFPPDLTTSAADIIDALRRSKLQIATAESCTGGLLTGLLTEIAGSSDVVVCGYVTYSNSAKTAMIGVPAKLIEAHGAVSREVADAMAAGALAHSRADIAISITGIAGPGGGSDTKPVGLVYIAAARRGAPIASAERRFGAIGRSQVRMATLRAALALLREATT